MSLEEESGLLGREVELSKEGEGVETGTTGSTFSEKKSEATELLF